MYSKRQLHKDTFPSTDRLRTDYHVPATNYMRRKYVKTPVKTNSIKSVISSISLQWTNKSTAT